MLKSKVKYIFLILFVLIFAGILISANVDAQSPPSPPDQCTQCPYGHKLTAVYDVGLHDWTFCEFGEENCYVTVKKYQDIFGIYGYKICSNIPYLTTYASANGKSATLNYPLNYLEPGSCFYVKAARSDYFDNNTQIQICRWNPDPQKTE